MIYIYFVRSIDVFQAQLRSTPTVELLNVIFHHMATTGFFLTCSDQIYTLDDEQMRKSAWVGLEDHPVVVDSENLFKGSLLHDSSTDCCSRRIVSRIVFFTSTWANDPVCILFFCFNHQLVLE